MRTKALVHFFSIKIFQSNKVFKRNQHLPVRVGVFPLTEPKTKITIIIHN